MSKKSKFPEEQISIIKTLRRIKRASAINLLNKFGFEVLKSMPPKNIGKDYPVLPPLPILENPTSSQIQEMIDSRVKYTVYEIIAGSKPKDAAPRVEFSSDGKMTISTEFYRREYLWDPRTELIPISNDARLFASEL